MRVHHRIALLLAGLGILAFSLACGGSSSTGTNTVPPAQGTVNLSLSDAGTEDWAQIGVKVLGVTLTPQGGGTPVTAYTAPSTVPVINLCQLDEMNELLGSMSVPEGTYTRATLTIAANPGDVTLVTASDPSPGFPVAGGTTIDPANIRIMGATGAAGSQTTTVSVRLENPLVVSASQPTSLDLEFDLSHPAFIVEHVPVSGPVTWAVSFNGPVRHHPVFDITRLVLRQAKGLVTSVASDNSAFTFTKEYEVFPIPTTGPAPILSQQSLTVQADATNGTLFYDMDARTASVVHDFSAQAGTLVGKHVRVAARYQANGTLTAVRVWASSTWAKVWISPEGHVNHVDATNGVIYLDNENGHSVPVAVDANTSFYFRTPARALADAAPIGTGPAFLTNLYRGFKVHISVVDPLAATLTAKLVDIEIAKFDGRISNANSMDFTYTRTFRNAADNYTVAMPYCSSSTANGMDASGNPIMGFKWWNFAFPTQANTGMNAIMSFMSAVSGSANFGGTVGAVPSFGVSFADWGNAANPSGWSAKWSVLLPCRVPLGQVSSPWASSANGGSFGLSVPGGTNPVTVNLSTVAGSATLVYDVNYANGVLTVTPVDITTAAGQASLATYLVNGTTVRTYGIPQADGSIKAYVLAYVH